MCVCCPKPSITIHTYDDVSIVRCSPCNVLPKPQRSRLIPAAFPYFHGHKPHREGQGSLESVPKPACCMWKRPLCHDPAAGLCIIPAFGDGCIQVLLQQIPPTKQTASLSLLISYLLLTCLIPKISLPSTKKSRHARKIRKMFGSSLSHPVQGSLPGASQG